MKKLSELGISQTPWEAVYDSMNDEESPYRIDVPPCYSLDGQFNEADAKLIAAAPELYEALYRLLVVAENRMPSIPTVEEIEVVNKAKAALAKAGGEEVE